MPAFHGFPSGKARFTPVPEPFFTELLPQIDHLGELKVTLYAFWRLDQMEGRFRYLRFEDFAGDERLMAGMGKQPDKELQGSLDRAVARGTLLAANIELEGRKQVLYLLNTPKGQAALGAIEKGLWQPSGDENYPIEPELAAPNIFRLYEQHIGPLTPMISEALTEAEAEYPSDWIEEALRIAVENNVRKWRYVEAILRAWQEEGKDDRTDKKGAEEDRRKYVEGKYSEFIEH
jgi:DnaD/phage-associated family protein